MPGEIYVGSVAVSVVPDLRGFNYEMRRQLVPAAADLGKEIARELTRSIRENLDIGKIIEEQTARSYPAVRRSGYEIGLAYGRAFRRGVELAMEDMHVKVKMDMDASSLAKFKAESAAATRTRTEKVKLDVDTKISSIVGGLFERLGFKTLTGGGGGGGVLGPLDKLLGLGGGARSTSFGFRQLLQGQQLSGITSIFAALPFPIQATMGAAVAAAVPLLAQSLSGLIVGGLGTGLAGLGILGAVGLGKGVAPGALAAAQDRLAAAQGRAVAAQDRLNQLQTGGGATSGQLAAAHLRVTSAQDRLNTLQNSGTASASALASAQASLISSQDRLNRLQHGGHASASQLASAQAAVASAHGSVASAQDKLKEVRAEQVTPGQLAVRTGFQNLVTDFKADLATIGEPMIPVLQRVFGLIGKVMDKLTPVFKAATGIIAGPMEKFADAFLKAFGDPTVQKSITDVANAFVGILTALTPDIPGIVDSFAQAVSRMAGAVTKNPKAFADFANFVAQFIIAMVDALAWLTDFADWVEFHWPQIWTFLSVPVQAAVTAWKIGAALISGIVNFLIDIFHGRWGKAWDDLKMIPIRVFNAMKDLVVRIWHSILDLVGHQLDQLRHNTAAHFDEIRHDFAQWGDDILRDVRITWNDIYGATIGALIRMGHNIEHYFTMIRHNIANIWDGVRHDVAHYWDVIYNNTIGAIIRLIKRALALFSGWKQDIINFFANAINWITNAGRNIITGLWNGLEAVWRDVSGWFGKVPGWVSNFFSGALNWIFARGRNIITGLWNGVKQVWNDVVGWFKGLPSKILGALGIKSPPQWALDAGKHIMGGLLKSLTHGAKDVKAFFVGLASDVAGPLKSVWSSIGGFFSGLWHKVAGGGSGGVQRWAPVVAQALSMMGMPASLLPQVLYQMQTESGGDPNAINLTDINAQRGDPSKGLVQVIGGTFARFHVAGTSFNIYDPLANIAAAIAYAAFTYGPGLMRGGMGLGSGHGYASGTSGAATGWAWVGEAGPELVRFSGGEQVIAVGRGYATGTSVGTLEAEIARLNASIAILNARMGSYAAGSAGQLGRNQVQAQINVDRARIRDLQDRIFVIQHPTVAAASRISAAAARAAAAAITKMANAGATLAAALARITTKTTAAGFASDQALFLKDLRYYFSPSVADARSRLVIAQIKELQNLQAHIATLNTNIANAVSFQKTELTHLQAGTGLGFIGIQGSGAAQGAGLLSGLQNQARVIVAFTRGIRALASAGASQALIQQYAGMDPGTGGPAAQRMAWVLRALKQMKAPAPVVNQLTALGADAAFAYVQAIQHADPKVRAGIFAAETNLANTQLAASRGIASVAYGGAYTTGANFVAGLQSQEKQLNALFAKLGKTLGEEAIKWMRVPAKQRPYGYQHGGWLNEPVSGWGMYSGAPYMFAERGREYVVPEAHMGRGGASGTEYHAHFDGLTGEAIEGHVRTAFNAMSLTQGNLQRQGRRS